MRPRLSGVVGFRPLLRDTYWFVSGYLSYAATTTLLRREFTPLTVENIDDTSKIEVDKIEVLQVEEVLMPEMNDNNDEDDYDAETLAGDEVIDTEKDAAAETITTIDTFARAKVANFMKRMIPTSSTSTTMTGATTATTSATLGMEVREVQTAGDYDDNNNNNSGPLFHARLRLPLPPEYGERWGEGLAPSEKEAELVAAMHAERVIDALGFHMFQLTSKQRRHAEAARGAGRWAPMPEEGPKPTITPSPPRLQLVREGATKAVERKLQIDKITFSSVTTGAFTPMKLTLASPFFLDPGSVYRIKQFFAAYNQTIQRYCRVTALHKTIEKGGFLTKNTILTDNNNNDNNKMFVAQIKLPIDIKFGERIACGKAPTKREAVILACMHAELIIDAIGIALYPSNREKQEIHTEECRKVNRWCSGPDDCDYHYTKPSPPPLQLVKESIAITATESDSTASLESILISHAKAIKNFTNITELKTLNPSARYEFINYISQYGNDRKDTSSPFFVEALGIKDHYIYRATTTVPIPIVESINSTENNNSLLSSFVAIGIGTSEMEAETAASMHALSVLELLNRLLPNSNSSESEKIKLNLTREMKIPPPYRHVIGHIGRIMVPGLSSVRVLGTSPMMRHRQDQNRENNEARIRKARNELPKEDWLLDSDAEGYIIVNPNLNIQEGRNYVHTLPSVRQADRFAIIRLKDYLERHGKRLEAAIVTNNIETDEGLKRWITKVTLPVPESFGIIIAHGEAYTEEEALVMCAVHAEIILDEIGVALYDLPILQSKHCDAASMLGRLAPYETLIKPKTTCIPPPVRKEHLNSCLWARLSKEISKGGYCSINKNEKDNDINKDISDKSEKIITSSSATVASSSTTISSSSSLNSTSIKENITDDVLCDLTTLNSVHPSEFFRHAPRLLTIYCKRQGVDISRSLRQYNVSHSLYGFIHRAIMEIPVPAQFGTRYAIGCAGSKKDAFLLCCMHAVFTLSELGIAIYTGNKQAEFAAMTRARGKYAPRPEDALRAGNTKSPPGLKCLTDIYNEKPEIPIIPERRKCEMPFVWSSYVTACRGYIQKVKEQEIFDALFQQNKTPRSGIEVEDKGLDVVEALPLFNNAKSKLVQKCAAAGLPAPPPMSFRYEVYGKLPHRRYFVEQKVLGTPFIARGIGEEGQEAITRAAMHYEYIVGLTSTTQNSKGEIKAIMRHRNNDLFDTTIRDFTPRGKLSIMVLYTTLRAPFKPLHIILKERQGITGTTTSIYVSLIEMEDETGLRMAGKGEDKINAEEAKNRAIIELYKQLQRKSTFQAVAQIVQINPGLRAEAAAHLVNEKNIMNNLRLILSKTKIITPIISSSSSSQILNDFGNISYLLRSTKNYLESPELRLLFDITIHALGDSTSPAPITIPAATRQLMIMMGLITVNNTKNSNNNINNNNKLESGIEVNSIGVATTILATCLPPLVIRKGGNSLVLMNSSALPLQLGKLLLAGFLMDCLQLCIRVAALILSFIIEDNNNNNNNNNNNESSDILELISKGLSDTAQGFANIIAMRLKDLITQLKSNNKTSSFNPFKELLTSSLSYDFSFSCGGNNNDNNDIWGPLIKDELSQKEQARLRLAIAFSTFPKLFIQKKSATDDVLRLITLESRDQQQTARLVVPSEIRECFNYSSNSLSFSNSPSYSSFPCFCIFDTFVKNGISTGVPTNNNNNNNNISGQKSIFGAFIPPCGLLLASTFCNESRVLTISDDVPNMAIVDGILPVVMQTHESLNAMIELRQTLKLHWSILKPLPNDLQSAMEELIIAKHSLTHSAQASLLD